MAEANEDTSCVGITGSFTNNGVIFPTASALDLFLVVSPGSVAAGDDIFDAFDSTRLGDCSADAREDNRAGEAAERTLGARGDSISRASSSSSTGLTMESGGLRCSGEALRRLETRATSCCERDFILEWRDDLSVILRSSRGFSIDRFSTEASEAFSGDVTLLTESWEGWKEVGFFLLTSVSLSGNYSINDFTHAHYSDGRMFTRT